MPEILIKFSYDHDATAYQRHRSFSQLDGERRSDEEFLKKCDWWIDKHGENCPLLSVYALSGFRIPVAAAPAPAPAPAGASRNRDAIDWRISTRERARVFHQFCLACCTIGAYEFLSCRYFWQPWSSYIIVNSLGLINFSPESDVSRRSLDNFYGTARSSPLVWTKRVPSESKEKYIIVVKKKLIQTCGAQSSIYQLGLHS